MAAMSNEQLTSRLGSWREGAAKRAIVDFVGRVTDEAGRDYVPAAERIAVFDNDGTLWCEKPVPVQADFLLRRVAEMAARDPSLTARQPWKAVVEKDYAWLGGAVSKHYLGDDADLKVMAVGLLQAYGDATIEEFAAAAQAFFATAKHPKLARPYPQCVYQPMVDLLGYLSAHGFTSYIVSGGGRDFMRVIAEPCYGIPPEHVIGSSSTLKLREQGAYVTLAHAPELGVFDDGPMKPVAIWTAIGRRPILAGGNSNGDVPMLRFCAQPGHPSLALLIDHDDAEREMAYQAGAEDAVALARRNDWTIASIKNDWQTVFA
jgi:phosphoglycolate phosphatase-like HAD superfamily hydrolase